MQSRDQICHAPLPCLVPRPPFSSRPKRFGSRGPCENVPRKRTSPKRIDREGLAKRRTGIRQPRYPGQVSAQPDWSGKKDGDCENFWKFSSLKKIAYLILRAFNLRPGWISGKVYQITYKIKDFPSSHMYRRSILTASSHVQANMAGSSDIDFVLKIFAKSLSCIVTPFVRNTHGKSGGGFVCHLDRKIIL